MKNFSNEFFYKPLKIFDIKNYFLYLSSKNFLFKLFYKNFLLKFLVTLLTNYFFRNFFVKFFRLPKKFFYNVMLFYNIKQHSTNNLWWYIKTHSKILKLLLLTSGFNTAKWYKIEIFLLKKYE